MTNMAKELDKAVTPSEYFNRLKKLKKQNTDESLNQLYDVALAQLKKYKLFGQKRMIRKLMFVMECIPKEKQLLDLGITTYIYKDDIEDFINMVEAKAVKLIEMENFPRDIPDEFSEIIQATINIFDGFYVLFTDYTGKEEKRIAKERKEKDPILLGVFKNNSEMNDRFYYLGDWVDEYCDLTLEKMLEIAGEDILRSVTVPEDKEELIKQCNDLVGGDSNNHWITPTGATFTIDSRNIITNNSSSTAQSINVININNNTEDNEEVENGSDN